MEAKPIFAHEQAYGLRMFVLVGLSIALMVGDHRFHYLHRIRYELASLVQPVQRALNAPGDFINQLAVSFRSHQNLLSDNEQLMRQQLYLQAQVQQLATLNTENQQLRALLHAPLRQSDHYVMADVIQFDPDPFNHLIVLNRGSQDGIQVGQPVLDVSGIMGKIVEISRNTCRIMLITDASHALPIENARNGLRAILAGTGDIERLELQHIPATMDFKLGDELITSGLGGGYPAGYPVGTVDRIVHGAGASFTSVWVKPKAHLETSRHLLMVEPSQKASELSHES